MSVNDYCRLVENVVLWAEPSHDVTGFAAWMADTQQAETAVRLAAAGQNTAALRLASRVADRWGVV